MAVKQLLIFCTLASVLRQIQFIKTKTSILKRLLLLLFFIPFFSLAQVPQGVGYQGVATDNNGIELVNQSISIRASVLSGSATGTVEWEETHATTTDAFGLFTLTIGQGTNTTNGAQANFADISWGTNTHFLKIEMDVTGGSTYSFMGTNQMMSVPYALYAESANINYDSISNLLSNDSTFITNVGGGMGGGGCNYAFPEGIEGQTIAWDLGVNNNQNDYTVPAGKNLFITNVYTNDGSSFRIDGIRVLDEIWGVPSSSQQLVGMLKLPLCVKAGQVISANTGGPNTFYGILTDATVEPISFWFDDPGTGFDTYTVPSGKRLVVTNLWMSGSSNDDFTIDGVIIASKTFNKVGSNGNKYLEIPLIINSGSVFSAPNHFASFNGYLADENYFAGCGGGGGSSSSNSNLIVNTVSQYGDTLYLADGSYLIIPGLSQSNLHYHFHNYGTVTDADGNIYKTLIYGNNEWMIENLKTAIGNYSTVAQHPGGFQSYADSVGYYYSASDVSSNVCPTGWHVSTIQDWQDLHYEIYGTNMNPTGYTNSGNGYDDNNYTILWSQYQGGTNQSAFNLFRTGYWSNSGSYITGDPEAAYFWSADGCTSGNLYRVNLFDGNAGGNPWSLDVGCTSGSNVKAQVRCVKD